MSQPENKPAGWYESLLENDGAFKAVFDHFRNFTIAGGIVAIGIFVAKHEVRQTFFDWFGIVSGYSIAAVGLFLGFINERHGRRKYLKLKIPLFWDFIFRLTYSLSVIPLIGYFILKAIG
ncbi:hypothetical protein [Herbaspirillum huttiense]|uniref:hypothetical protein n=1 Tax=Herbaspirillum huttiense TaxID=863372 RepID=UPI000585887D|nr:hypothetical protein [Herbaspirillum huttiense]